MNQQISVTVKFFLRSREREDDLPKSEAFLVMSVSLPIAPFPGLWLPDISTHFNIVIESVAIEGGGVVGYAKPWEIPESRIEEVAQRFVDDGWRRLLTL